MKSASVCSGAVNWLALHSTTTTTPPSPHFSAEKQKYTYTLSVLWFWWWKGRASGYGNSRAHDDIIFPLPPQWCHHALNQQLLTY